MKRSLGSCLNVGGFTLRALLTLFALSANLALAVSACGDGDDCSKEGEEGGPMCCNDGCGLTTANPLPSICHNNKWTCRGSNPVRLEYCATQTGACQARKACTGEVGLGNEEPDPAPEICCMGGCNGEEVLHRVCKTGTTYDCPDGAIPISRCPSPFSACNGAIHRYRKNGNKLPLP
ncbi:MAG: hypothetical protein CSA65_02720 [Proteobacteria bacterium]|nr:MAG: hypothetical protein CSA65_02720 [Pseudomonadota bacterium]